MLFLILFFFFTFFFFFFFFSSRRRHTRSLRDWSSDVCSSDLAVWLAGVQKATRIETRVAARRAPGSVNHDPLRRTSVRMEFANTQSGRPDRSRRAQPSACSRCECISLVRHWPRNRPLARTRQAARYQQRAAAGRSREPDTRRRAPATLPQEPAREQQKRRKGQARGAAGR